MEKHCIKSKNKGKRGRLFILKMERNSEIFTPNFILLIAFGKHCGGNRSYNSSGIPGIILKTFIEKMGKNNLVPTKISDE